MNGGLVPIERAHGEVLGPLHDLAGSYLATQVTEASTLRTYRSALGRFLLWLLETHGEASPQALTERNLADYQQELRSTGCKPATVRKERAAINGLLRYLLERPGGDGLDGLSRDELIRALQVRQPRGQGEKAEVKALSAAQYRQLRNALEAKAATGHVLWVRNRAVVYLMSEAGLRAEEVMGLCVDDFRERRKGARLRSLLVRGKGSRERRVPIYPETLQPALEAWHDARRAHFGRRPHGGEPLICTVARRRPPPGAGQQLREVREAGGAMSRGSLVAAVRSSFAEAALPEQFAHPHALRHTFALEFLRRQGNRRGEARGDDLNNLRELLGHADLRTTSVYARPPAAEIEAAMLAASEPLTLLDEDVDR